MYDILLNWLAPDLQDMPPELRPCIQEEHAVVRQQSHARSGEVAAADPPGLSEPVRGAQQERVFTTAVRPPEGLASAGTVA